MKETVRLAVFASGNGSNLEAIQAACVFGAIPAKIVAVVCNKPDARAVRLACQWEIPIGVFNHHHFLTRERHEEAILNWLEPHQAEFVALAGYMRLLTKAFIRAFGGRVLNIHPADTRKHQGGGGYDWALAQGLSETAVTVHWVDEGMDTGGIVLQEAVPIAPDDTLDTLRSRGLAAEQRIYPRALAKVFADYLSPARGLR